MGGRKSAARPGLTTNQEPSRPRRHPGGRQRGEKDLLGDIKQIGFDPWNAGTIEQDLTDDGFEVVEIPQILKHMSAPSKEFEADVLDGLADAGGNPLMAVCISNVVVYRDGKDNIYPQKKKSRGRIDPVIAALMARKLAAIDTTEPPAADPELLVA